nr:putative ribonuclease H-like domain-containing protein [Tanacetum cinerariifolium]
MEEKKKLKHDFKIREDKFLDKEVDLEARIKDLENILLKRDQTVQTMHMLNPKPDLFYHPNQKMALGYPNPSYLKKAQQKQQSLYNGNLLLKEHDPLAVYDSKETLKLAQESREKMRLLNKEIKPSNYAKINHLSGVFVPQTTQSKEELFLLNVSNMVTASKTISIPNEDLSDDTTPSVARKFLNEVKSSLVTLQRVVKQKIILEVHNWSSSAHKEEADKSLDKQKYLELEIKRLLKVSVSHDIMSIVQNSLVDVPSDLQTKLDRTKEKLELCIIKKEKEYVVLWNNWYTKYEECKYDKISYDKAYNDMQQKVERLQAHHLKTTYKNLFDSIKSNRAHAKLYDLIFENAKLRARLFKNTSESVKNTSGTSVTPHVDKPNLSAVTPHSKKLHASTQSHSVPQPREFNVVKHRNVIAPGMFKINQSQTPRVDLVPNKQSSASIRTNPITNSQRHVTVKENVSFNTSSTGLVHTAKTRRPQPKGNTRNARVPSASKSSAVKEIVTVEDQRRTLLLSKNQKTMSSECNNIKLAIRNDKSKIVCDTCCPNLSVVRRQGARRKRLRDLKGKSSNTPSVSNTLDPLNQKLESKIVELEFQVLNYERKISHLKTTYKNLFDSIKSNREHAKLHDIIFENAKLRARLFKNTSEFVKNISGTSVTPHVDKPKLSAVTPLSKKLHVSMSSHSVPQPREFNVVKHKNVIAPGMFKINPSQTPRVDLVPNKQSSASIRTNPITNSQRHVIVKENMSSNMSTAYSTRLVHTARTRRPQPKGNIRNARVPSASKSSEVKKSVWKPKQVGSKERLASKPRLPRLSLKWSPSGRSFDQKGKLVASKGTNFPNDDKACTSNPQDPMRKWFPNSFVLLGSFRGTVRFGNDHIDAILGYSYLKWGNITITRVYFVEGLGHNLFSVGQFCDADLEVAFRRNTCFIRDLDGVDGKSKRASHLPKLVPNSKQVLYLLHMDLCGPMRVASINGKQYVLVIVDDYSRYTWVHFLRTKDETPEVIKNFLKKISVHLQAPVIIVRTDNGTKFKNQVLKEYFDSVGITHETFAAKTPQQNGVIERRNRTLVEAARTIVYNRRTKKIMETINVTVDELSAMAFEQNSSRPELQKALRVISAAPVLQNLQAPAASMSFQDSTSVPTNSSNTPVSSHNADATSQQHAQQQKNLTPSPTASAANNVLNAGFEGELFVNPIGTPSTDMIGALMYLTSSKPDIVHATCDSGFELTGFLDADYAGCKDTFKSTSGGAQFIGEKLVSWSSKKQDCTSLSTAKSEYVSLSACCAQVLWMRTQLTDYGYHFDKILIYGDSKSAIAISCNLFNIPE